VSVNSLLQAVGIPAQGIPDGLEPRAWLLSGDTQHRSLSINVARLLFLTVESARS
jgi:hypothetical protein